jgi:hypothetical protein
MALLSDGAARTSLHNQDDNGYHRTVHLTNCFFKSRGCEISELSEIRVGSIGSPWTGTSALLTAHCWCARHLLR